MKYPRLSAIFVAATAASLLMASTASFAHKENFKGEVPPPCPPVMMLHDGFYIGAGVGYDAFKIHRSTTVTETALAVVPAVVIGTQSAHADLGATGWMGGVFAGYGHYWDWMYLGLEINANDSSAKSSTAFNDTLTGTSGSVSAKARGSYGVGLLPGLKLNDSTLLYVRLAYLRADFKTSYSATDPDVAPGAPVTTTGSSSEWRNGFQYGVGLETYVAEQVSLRGEFDHVRFNSKSINASVTVPAIITVASSTSIKPSNNEFMLSLLYHFC